MADYFPYFIEATYQFEGTCAVLVLPNGSDIRIDEEAHVSGIYQGDGSVLITYTYVVYTRGERESKKVSEQFVLRPGERIIKKYYEQSITRLSNIWTHETEISLVPLEENKDRYFRIYREEGENDYDKYIGVEPRHKHPKEQPLGSMDPDLKAEYTRGK